MIDKPTIARIMDATNIVDVVSEFVSLKKRGVNYIGLCLSIMIRILPSLSRPHAASAIVSPVEREATPSTS